jgi:hypothetical protein
MKKVTFVATFTFIASFSFAAPVYTAAVKESHNCSLCFNTPYHHQFFVNHSWIDDVLTAGTCPVKFTGFSAALKNGVMSVQCLEHYRAKEFDIDGQVAYTSVQSVRVTGENYFVPASSTSGVLAVRQNIL